MQDNAQKTVREWLETLPEPARSRALTNMESGKTHIKASSLSNAILLAFLWHQSPEGQPYWCELFKNNLP